MNNLRLASSGGPDDQGERFVTVLEIPPMETPQTAAKVEIAAEARGKK